jgi:chemotaxis protein MotB
MRFISFTTMLSLLMLISGCVSLSTYNEKVSEAETLKKNLAASEAAGKAMDGELQQLKEKLARLRQQHEDIKTATIAGSDQGAIATGKKAFADNLEWLEARLSEYEARIKELTAREEAARKTAPGEALAERDQQIKNLQAKVDELQKEVAELSRNRTVADEKENAAAAVRLALKHELAQGEVQLKEYRDKMILSLPEQILFDSGSAAISKKGEKLLKRMAKILKKVDNNQLRVEGHTDSAPIGKKLAGKFPTNWDLAAARATSVVKYLQQQGKVNARVLALAGYGPNVPAAANTSEKGRKLNRRIEIALVPFEKPER